MIGIEKSIGKDDCEVEKKCLERGNGKGRIWWWSIFKEEKLKDGKEGEKIRSIGWEKGIDENIEIGKGKGIIIIGVVDLIKRID